VASVPWNTPNTALHLLKSVTPFEGDVSQKANNTGWMMYNTGRFIMYSRITKIYCRKTVGHVFRKSVQIEGTTQFLFSPS
jgi:hypothetical protein